MKKDVRKVNVVRVFDEDGVSFDTSFESVINGVIEDAVCNGLDFPQDLEVA